MSGTFVNWDQIAFPADLRGLRLDEKLRIRGEDSGDDFLAFLERPDGFVLIAPQTARLDTDIVRYVLTARSLRPDVSIFYGDEVVVGDGGLKRHICKPQLNAAMLMANNYLGFPLIVHSTILREFLATLKTVGDVFWFDLCVLAVQRGLAISRIGEFLIQSDQPYLQPDRTSRIHSLDKAFRAKAPSVDFRPGLTDDSIEMRKIFASYPNVTVVITTTRSPAGKSQKPSIVELLQSLASSTWPMNRLKVLIGDQNPPDGFYDLSVYPFDIEVVKIGEVSPSPGRALNSLWRLSDAENIIFLTDDTVVSRRDWIEALLSFSTEVDVGVAGARLISPDRRLLHAGIIAGIFDHFVRPWFKLPADSKTYQDWSLVQRDCSAVCGSAMATRKTILEKVNGFHESLNREYAAIDMCLKMQVLGFRTVYTPFAELICKSAGQPDFSPASQTLSFLNCWRDIISDDPMYSPNLSRNDEKIFCSLD